MVKNYKKPKKKWYFYNPFAFLSAIVASKAG